MEQDLNHGEASSDDYYNLVLEYLERSDTENALKYAEKVLMLNEADGAFLMGLIAEEQRNEKSALDWHLKAAKLGMPDAMVQIAIGNFESGKAIEEAIAWCKQADICDHPPASNALARHFYYQNNYPEALRWTRRTVELLEEDFEDSELLFADALYLLAFALDALGIDEDNSSIYRRSAELGSSDSCCELACILLDKKHFSEAEKFIKRAVESEHPMGYSLMGDLENLRGNSLRCLDNWQQAIELEEYDLIEHFEGVLIEVELEEVMQGKLSSQPHRNWFDNFLNEHTSLPEVQRVLSERRRIDSLVDRSFRPQKKSNVELGDESWISGKLEAARHNWQVAARTGDPRAEYRLGLIDLDTKDANEVLERWKRIAHHSAAIQAAIAALYFDLGQKENSQEWFALAFQSGWNLPPCGLICFQPANYLIKWVDMSFRPAGFGRPESWRETFTDEAILVISQTAKSNGQLRVAAIWEGLLEQD